MVKMCELASVSESLSPRIFRVYVDLVYQCKICLVFSTGIFSAVGFCSFFSFRRFPLE